jgi:hypothetical protein
VVCGCPAPDRLNPYANPYNQGWMQEPAGGFHYDTADAKLAANIQYTFRC